VRLHARTDGPADAPPLVLLGPVGSTTDMWTPVLRPLTEQYRVVRIDHRGHGGSSPSPTGSPSMLADLADDVLATLDDLGITLANYVGLSLGGMVGMWLAIHRPERIGRLALLCTSAFLGSSYTERAGIVRAHGMEAVADQVVARWVTPSLAARDAQVVASLRAMLTGIDAESYAQCCDAIGGMNLRADLGRVAAPTLVIAGKDDPATPPEHLEVIADGISGAQLVVVPDAAHLPTIEQPGAVALLLLDHFRGGATLAAGYRVRRAVLGNEHVDRTVAATTPFAEPFQQLLTRYAWGDVWSRSELGRRERSIVTLAVLIALGAENELAMHVRAARRNGLSDSDIGEVIMHVALYAGLPRANRAMAIASDVLAQQG
jgi:3-oxoadipate enol-lactonase/4-carboxymuconolactone decarboxylase